MSASGLFDDLDKTPDKATPKAHRVKPGFYLMHRGWMDSPVFGGASEPLCRRAAWVWLIDNAAWKPTTTTIQGKMITVGRGQISTSYRFLAKAWNWHPATDQPEPGHPDHRHGSEPPR